MVRRINPLRLIIAWLTLAMVVTIIYMIVLGIATSGGEQRPFTFLGRVIPIIVYGVLTIAIVSIPFYFEWLKKKWYINLLFVIACTIFIAKDLAQKKENIYYTNKRTVLVNNKEYEQTIQYYDSKSTKMRSVSFYVKGKRDSTWSLYSEDGNMISQKKYKDGILIAREK